LRVAVRDSVRLARRAWLVGRLGGDVTDIEDGIAWMQRDVDRLRKLWELGRRARLAQGTRPRVCRIRVRMLRWNPGAPRVSIVDRFRGIRYVQSLKSRI
jgi:hypothetical protein